MTYSSDKNIPANLKTISTRRAKQIIEINRRGDKPDTLLEDDVTFDEKRSADLLEQNNINRFDNNTSRSRKRKRINNREYRNDNRKGRKKDSDKPE